MRFDCLKHDFLLTTVSKELACDACRTLGRGLHLTQEGELCRGDRAWLIEHHLDVPPDDSEQVIKVVCNAAGELTERLQLLGVLQLRFEELAFFFSAIALAKLKAQLIMRSLKVCRPLFDTNIEHTPCVVAIGQRDFELCLPVSELVCLAFDPLLIAIMSLFGPQKQSPHRDTQT